MSKPPAPDPATLGYMTARLYAWADDAGMPREEAEKRARYFLTTSPWCRALMDRFVDLCVNPPAAFADVSVGVDPREPDASLLGVYGVGSIHPQGEGWAVICADGAWQFHMSGEDALAAARKERAEVDRRRKELLAGWPPPIVSRGPMSTSPFPSEFPPGERPA